MSISNAKPEHPVPSAVIGRVQLLAVAIAAALLQAFVINQLVARGIVEKIIPWDECGYIYSAINNVVSIKQGIWHGLQYAHSPLAMFPLTLVTYLFPQS